MILTIAGITFERAHYDERSDVLYLSVEGHDGPPVDAFSTPEGHNVEYDEAGRIAGMTLTNVRWLLDRDGDLTITLPAEHARAARPAAIDGDAAHVSAAELAPALTPAA